MVDGVSGRCGSNKGAKEGKSNSQRYGALLPTIVGVVIVKKASAQQGRPRTGRVSTVIRGYG